MDNTTLLNLYKSYGRLTVNEIRDRLKVIKLVLLDHKGPGTIYGYYPIVQKFIDNLALKPRIISWNMTAGCDTENSHIEGLEEFKTITYLVKSSSRFILKADVGEIFDQIDDHDLSEIKAICLVNDYQVIDNTEGEDFLMNAILLK